MRTFTDNQGQQWSLSLSLARVNQVRLKMHLDILNPTHHQRVLESLTDRLTYAYLLLEQQANELGVSMDEFEERLYGESFAMEAGFALMEEMSDFYQKLGLKGQALLTQRAIKSMKAGTARVNDMVKSGQLNSLLDRAESEMDSLLRGSDGIGLPSSPPSPG